jgi:hypothetical protein
MTRVSKLIPRKVAKEHLGDVPTMTLWRLEKNSESGFPCPVLINGRVYYEENKFSAWLARRPRKLREIA